MERRLGKRHNGAPVAVKAYIATPAYNGRVDTDYAVSIAESSMIAANMGIGVVAGIMGNGAFIEMSRNQFVALFLQTDCTHLFFIDSDLKWEARAFVGTVLACTEDRPAVAGAYLKRQEVEEYPIRYWEDPESPGITIEHGGFVRCDRVATGFLCLHRSVVEKMAREADVYLVPGWGYAPRLFYTVDVPLQAALKDDAPENKDGPPKWADPEKVKKAILFKGEDFAWCDDYIRRFPDKWIYVWPDFDFKHGGRACNWDKFIKQALAEYEETMKEARAESEAIAEGRDGTNG